MIYLSKDKQIFWHDLNTQLIDSHAMSPTFRIEMPVIPSMNDYLSAGRNWQQLNGFKARWEKQGFEAAIRAAYRAGFEVQEWTEFDVGKNGQQIKTEHKKIKTPIIEYAKVILRIWRPSFANYDVFNPYTKSIIDGFVKAGVMVDDNCFNVHSFEQKFMGVDESLKPTAEAKEARRLKRLDKPNRRQPVNARHYFDFIE